MAEFNDAIKALKEAGVFPIKDKFGEIGKGDATAQIEQRVQATADVADHYLNSVMPEIINREPNSHPIPRKDQLADWAATIVDPQALAQRYQGLAKMQSYGPERAKLEMLRWHDRMRKAMENASGL